MKCNVFVWNDAIVKDVEKSLQTMCSVQHNAGKWVDHMAASSDDDLSQTTSHVAVLMDDVDIQGIDVVSFLNTMNESGYDLASGSIDNWHYECMHSREVCRSHRTDYVDVLFAVFTAEAWLCWKNQFDLQINSYGWGYDVTFADQCKAKVGVVSKIALPPFIVLYVLASALRAGQLMLASLSCI
jgi:hypothetical protein